MKRRYDILSFLSWRESDTSQCRWGIAVETATRSEPVTLRMFVFLFFRVIISLNFFFFRGRRNLCAEINTSKQLPPRILQGPIVGKIKFQSTGRVGGYWPIPFVSKNKILQRHKCFRLTWAQCEVSRLLIRNPPRVERQPVNNNREINL